MTFTRATLLGGIAATLAATAVFAASHANVEGAIKARQSHMQLYAFNLGILGNMAKGEVAFDADAAQAAADNLAALAAISQAAYWPEGSDADSVEGTKALPAIWESGSDIGAKVAAMTEAADAMAAAAGSLEGVQGAMGALGGACGGCHQTYRQTN
ncbi:cytochrome c [Psychromarinibacter sp. S121]|uniref:cytochrome c n=1 Tax=Psychromarinibacter sp. S121 TaxID=3415127 RepID=UPI003C7C6348